MRNHVPNSSASSCKTSCESDFSTLCKILIQSTGSNQSETLPAHAFDSRLIVGQIESGYQLILNVLAQDALVNLQEISLGNVGERVEIVFRPIDIFSHFQLPHDTLDVLGVTRPTKEVSDSDPFTGYVD